MNYQFAAIRGIQSEREYYVVMCPLKLIPRIFLYDEEVLPAELRAQRTLNQARVPEIANYMIDNADDYVFSAITASIDGDAFFDAEGQSGYKRSLGILNVPMTAQFLINDGQHRRAAIEQALKENPDLGDETIAVVLFIDAGLERCQQMFADLNKHAVRPSKSISILYDHRDALASLAVDLTDTVPMFKGITEMEKTTISNRSTNLFTLNAIYQATNALLGKKKGDDIHDKDKELAIAYWNRVGEVIPEMRLVINRKVSAAELRQNYVHSHGVALQAIGEAGKDLLKLYPEDWQERLLALESVDWRRVNTDVWEGRAMRHGKMSKARTNVGLTVNWLKRVLELPLTEKEFEYEALLESEE